MNWKRRLGWLGLLAALTGVLWLSRPSHDHPQPQSNESGVASVEPGWPRPTDAMPPKPLRYAAKPRPFGSPPKAPPQTLHVEWRGSWYPAEILSSSGSNNLIRYVGYGAEWDEWVTSERMRYQPLEKPPPQSVDSTTDAFPATSEPLRMQPAPGDLVVKWGNRWWRAEILQTQGENSLIRYVGYDSQSDEWVTPDRVKIFSPEDAPPSTPELVVHGSPARGEPLVQWGGQWWPADILQTQGSSYLIHYKDYGPEWDEWVTAERLGIYEGNDP